MDALSDVLRTVRLTGAIFFDVHASAPWAAETPAGDTIVGAMFPGSVDVVRRYIETLPADRTDWLAGLRDPFIGRALAALHHDPARDWTIEGLARGVGLSRSALAQRFTEFVGQPPMQYLMKWRMQLAANHLVSGRQSIAVIANLVGYDSEAAFSRVFKKVAGTPPSEWRKQRADAEHGVGDNHSPN